MVDYEEVRNEEERLKIMEHPCVKGDGCGALFDFPNPSLKCSVDGHTALDILGALQCLDSLYEDCPKRKIEDFKSEFSNESDEFDDLFGGY